MSTHRAPKQWYLSKSETINSFENERQNLLYTLSLDSNFSPFLAEGITWGKKTTTAVLRGFTDDGKDVAEASHLTVQQKVNFLELMLGQIAYYCVIISRNTLVKNSTSIQSIWKTIRQHFGFQISGAHLSTLPRFTWNPIKDLKFFTKGRWPLWRIYCSKLTAHPTMVT